MGLSPMTLGMFMSYSWPGNVRELKSVLEYAFVLADHGQIEPEHLPMNIQVPVPTKGPTESVASQACPAEADQKTQLVEALRRAGGNKSEAARILGINRVTVLNRMRKYGVDMKTVIQV